MATVTATEKENTFSPSRSMEMIREEIGDLETFEAVLAFAIDEEKKGCDFYLGLAKRMRDPWLGKAFARLAREKTRQRERLLRMRYGPYSLPIFEKALPPKLTEYARAAVIPARELDTREALTVAIEAKMAAQKLFMELAAKAKDINLKVVFRAAAAEEAKRKASFEDEHASRFSGSIGRRREV